MVAPVLVISVGNESRGDDALGPLLARTLEANLKDSRLVKQVEFIEDFQLQIELALDLSARELVLFIDAGHHTHTPFYFYQAQANSVEGHTTHAISPEAVLHVYTTVYHEAPPPTFVLCVAGTAFELGEPLSGDAELHFSEATKFCQQLFKNTTFAAWQALVHSTAYA